MKKKIDQIYEYVERTILASPQGKGIQTDEVAAALHMQRTNVSTLLNQLVSQGKLLKSPGRPVVYSLVLKDQSDDECRLDKIVGRNGSLKMLIDRLEALISYPGNRNMQIMMVSEAGNEHEYVARSLHEYAVNKGIFDKNAPYVAVNCVHYLKNIDILNEKLFGLDDLSFSAFAHAENGLLYIRNVQYLTAEQQARIIEFMEYGLVYDRNHMKFRQCRHVTLLLSAPEDAVPQAFSEMQQVRIPPLKERPLDEKFALINHFFQSEARQAGITIGVSTQALCALLLSDVKENVRGIEVEIRSACASAYVRALGSHQTEMQVMMHDFSAGIRKGLLSDKKDNAFISILKSTNGDVIYFDASGINASGRMYTTIKQRMDELIKKGIQTDGLDGISSAFVPHMMDLPGDPGEDNDSQLSKIIDARIVAIVDICLHEYEKRNNKQLEAAVYNGLCLQINAYKLHQGGIRISDAEAKGIIEGHPVEFETCLYIASCLGYAKVIEGNLTVNEIAALARILINERTAGEKHPVVLYAMHGDHTASALAEVTNALTHLDNAYAFDLRLSYSSEEAVGKLKDELVKIDQGQGVIVIYDMGSIANMLNTIMEETEINIRTVNTPVTLLGLDAAWKSYEMVDVDDVYNDIRTMMRNHREEPERKSEVLICLCETGRGGAQELKRYIDEYSGLGIKTVALAISNKSVLIQRVTDLQKIYNIRAFVGTYDPKLFGIPFIAMNRVFHTSHEHLDQVLMFEPIEDKTKDYEQVYQMLSESLHYTSISKLKSTLPEIVDNLSESYQLNDNQKDGLFVHLACSVERLLSGNEEKPAIDEEQRKKVMRLNEDYGVVSRQVRKLEKAFNVIFDDNEIAIIIMILRKI